MSKFNCQVGEAIDFPRQQERRKFKKDKCCGFVGATVVADAVIEDELDQNEFVPLTANTLIGFQMLSGGTFSAQSCGTYSVTLKARVQTPGGSDIGPFTFKIEVTGCGPTRVIDVLTIPETNDKTVSTNTTVCLKKGEGIRVIAASEVELQGENRSLTLFLSASKISDCCDDNGILGSCRSCSCDKCDHDDHHDHRHSDRCDHC